MSIDREEVTMTCKFCIHITGPDDLVPVHDVAEAVRASAYLNAEYLATFHSLPQRDDYTPVCFAVPMVWPRSEEAHEEELKRLKARAKERGVQPHWLSS